MWWKFAFLYLFLYSGLTTFSVRYHHVNAVFNGFGHDYLYHSTLMDYETEEVYFDKFKLVEIIDEYFIANIKVLNHEHHITFYSEGRISNESERSRYFTIRLVALLGFNATYDKTYHYYLT